MASCSLGTLKAKVWTFFKDSWLSSEVTELSLRWNLLLDFFEVLLSLLLVVLFRSKALRILILAMLVFD